MVLRSMVGYSKGSLVTISVNGLNNLKWKKKKGKGNEERKEDNKIEEEKVLLLKFGFERMKAKE